jgi:hypothetical protein
VLFDVGMGILNLVCLTGGGPLAWARNVMLKCIT